MPQIPLNCFYVRLDIYLATAGSGWEAIMSLGGGHLTEPCLG